jgi:hypothetical protein
MERVTRQVPLARADGISALVIFGVGCSEIDDPTLDPVSDPRFAEPAPVLRDLGRDPNRNVFWGDLHIHTSLSYDAYTFDVRAMPDDAYVYAKGGSILHGIGYPIRATRPLDFAAVTDHAEYLGVPRSRGEADPNPPAGLREILETRSPWRITWSFVGRALLEMGSAETRDEVFGGDYADVSLAAWREVVATAERHNEPGRFTTFIAYEWSSMPDDDNLHRKVVYRSSRAPDYPDSSLDSKDPEDLWRALEIQRSMGMDVMAIPHNGNVRNGRM